MECTENALQKVHTALPYKKQLKCYAGVPHRDAQAHWQEGKGMGNRGFLCRADRPTESWQYRITGQGKRRGIREDLVRNCVGAIVTLEGPSFSSLYLEGKSVTLSKVLQGFYW